MLPSARPTPACWIEIAELDDLDHQAGDPVARARSLSGLLVSVGGFPGGN